MLVGVKLDCVELFTLEGVEVDRVELLMLVIELD